MFPSHDTRARLDIIDHVFNLAVDIAIKLGDDFCFFLTDCFFVTEAGREKVKELISGYGYECKEDLNTLASIETNANKVTSIRWKRGNPGKKNEFGVHQFNETLELRSIEKAMGLKRKSKKIVNVV